MSEPFSEQLGRVTQSLRRRGLDFALLATPPSVTYVSGFEASLQAGYTAELTDWVPSLALLGADGSGCLIVADTEAETAREQSWFGEVRSFASLGHFAPTDCRRNFADALRGALGTMGIVRSRATIGVEPALPRSAALVLAGECPGAELLDATAAIDEARRIKTPREIDLLRTAVAVADAGQRRLLELAHGDRGLTDVELWADIVTTMQALVGRPIPVVGALVTGTRTSVLTTPGPAGATVEPGDLALLDLGPRISGYWADCCNTVVFGAEPTEAQEHYLRATRASCETAMAALRPGGRCSDAADAIRTTLERHGLSMAHYGGHQIGAGVNEPPRLLPYDETWIEPGMVFAVEAGAYAGTGGETGARAEKVVLVTESGPEVLSAFPWQL